MLKGPGFGQDSTKEKLMTADWFSCAVIWRRTTTGVLEYLVVDVEYRGEFATQDVQLKFVGGCNMGHSEDKEPLDTLRRKLLEKASLQINPGVVPELIHHCVVGDGHQKFFFLISFEDLTGELRTESLERMYSVIYRPRWVKAYGAEVYKEHRRAARKGVRFFANVPVLVG